MKEQAKVLKKLEFSVRSETEAAYRFSFIYGVVPEGLSEFEIAISSLEPGETFTLVLEEIDPASFMDRLFPLFIKQTKLVELKQLARLEFTLEEMSEPATTEIVSAMAEIQKSRSCSGSCDCGCH